ncbi:MAG: transglycosylase SLT domain-containing protein [Parvibaculum sp.]|uniref:lytic transglycosylase domain-containing protein n=1 Tax=Parvibaculum sp. TaxID=2024848 RepID=UPI0025CF7D68|nr:transglycosylase SLT domain-containing protein [Parvibaculum sp.]MCE9649958.1 transglycosylase SLT domain-containing protein [Parvibaculum sp.]
MPKRKAAPNWSRGLVFAAVLALAAPLAFGASGAGAGTLGKLGGDVPVPAAAPQTAPISASAKIWSPEVLSGSDRERYLKIFAAQKRGDWKKADKLISQLADKRLMGYVLADRYMHPRYKSKYTELKAWMAEYASTPGADAIYKLALRKKPSRASAPSRPTAQRFRQPTHSAYAIDDSGEPLFSARFAKVDAKVRELVRDEKAVDALNFLNSSSIRQSLSDIEYDKARERIATSYFIENENERAYQVADEISRNHPREVPLADWYAGLAAWRMEQYADAASHFERLARSETVSDWSKAAGGFWAARAYLANRTPERVAEMLELSSDTGATFYGLLAARQLGREPRFVWTEPKLDRAGYEVLVADAAVARAVALVQIGRRDLAEAELVRAHGWLDPSTDPALIALAAAFKLPAVELQAASGADLPPARARNGEIAINSGLYPIPYYKPQNGFRVDPALFYAVMRQESKFRPDATSGAGARGLMQLMPATASRIAQDRTLASGNKDKLLDPSFNLTLAQDYLETLMASGEPRGNLYMLTTAYNGGPGNLSRWLDSINFKGDPFLFIESIPAPETRGYIERVLTNFWIYRSKLGQPLPSLDASASGDWPVYEAVASER